MTTRSKFPLEKISIVERNGKPVAVMMDIDEFEDLLEQADPAFQKSLKEAYSEYRAGRVYSEQEIKKSLLKG